MFFMTILTPRRCRRPIAVNCLIVFAFFAFFSFAFFTLNSYMVISEMISRNDDADDLLFPINRLKNNGFCIIWPATAGASSIGVQQLVITKLTDL